ncbi:MAG: uridine kinase [Erysipelotrichaceae bacterium]|nr:uridine kinase [Erysipelotrichaceae bacterium]
MKPLIVAISGGSASGKTTVVEEIVDRLKSVDITVICHDDYYKDQSDLSMEERTKTNYDHPNSLDNAFFVKQLQQLMRGESIEKPIYDFVNHNRKKETILVKPTKVIIIEGILVLEEKTIRDCADVKIFVKCDDDIRFIRRLKRDIEERGRSLDNVINQYLLTVKPMYNRFIEPSSKYADIIIPNDKKHDVAVDFLVAKLKDILNSNE